jgi:hypothetical protein
MCGFGRCETRQRQRRRHEGGVLGANARGARVAHQHRRSRDLSMRASSNLVHAFVASVNAFPPRKLTADWRKRNRAPASRRAQARLKYCYNPKISPAKARLIRWKKERRACFRVRLHVGTASGFSKAKEHMMATRGGTHEQHVKAGEQSHKNAESGSSSHEDRSHSSGGTHEQHVKAGEQSHKNTGSGSSSQGGTHEQHVKAGEQSHKPTPGEGPSSQGGTHEQHVKAGQQSHKNK